MVLPGLVDMEEESADVTEVLVGRLGVGVLWVVVSVAVIEGVVAEVERPSEVVSVMWVMGADGVAVVDVCTVPDVEAVGVTVDVGVLPVEELFEVVTPGVL